jgi:hypothetical protein
MAIQSFSMTVVRPDDLLVLRLDFAGVDLTGGMVGGAANAMLVVHFQPQHVAEEAFWEQGTTTETKEEADARNSTTPPSPPPPTTSENPGVVGTIGSRIAGPSRLAFRIPPGTSFPLTLESVLDALTTLPLNVTAVARYERNPGCAGVPIALLPLLGQPKPPTIQAPSSFETAIEAPYRLVLSPDDRGTWSHATKPVKHDGSVELWHTRLGSRRPDGDPRVRAVWSPDHRPNELQLHSDDPFRSALDARDRNEIVHLTANYYLDAFDPKPVRTDRLMLTTLGAWLDLEGNWDPPKFDPGKLTVEQWRHVATMGRDHYVRVVYAGYLMPFGHRASLVKITERKFVKPKEPSDLPGFVAYTLQRMFILVREPVRTFAPRDMPLRSVEIVTRSTPDLSPPAQSQVGSWGQEAFWPSLALNQPFQFHLIGTDWQQRRVEFPAPLLFVSLNVDALPAVKDVIGAYNSSGTRRTPPFLGQKVAFAQYTKLDDTSLETANITFKAEEVTGPDGPHFRPLMDSAQTVIPAVKELTNSTEPSTIVLEPGFIAGTGNAGDVFVKVTNAPKLEFEHETSGGLTTPNITIKGLSRSLGPTGDDAMIGGAFNPAAVFGDITLLGHLKLSDIVGGVTAGSDLKVMNRVPHFTAVRDGNVLRTEYLYTVDNDHLQGGTIFKTTGTSEFQLKTIVETPIGGGAPVFSTHGHLNHFDLALVPGDSLDLVHVQFNEVKFDVKAGQKLDTSVSLKGLEFQGILKFVNELQKYVPMDGFSDPPAVQLVTSPDPGVIVGFSLGLPTIGVGIMTMQNVALSASFFLPFTGKPMSFRFAFCERQQPFTLTVSLFGGGGFFALNVGLKGVTSLEASLEFGASIALNLGVASGQATIMAGFYFQIGENDLFVLTGYFRATGSLSVLGIISVSVEFYLGLTYATKAAAEHGGHLWGQATLTVKIKILFFSKSVGVSMEREFAGSDPTFRQLMDFDPHWTSYCGAFDDYAGIGEED